MHSLRLRPRSMWWLALLFAGATVVCCREGWGDEWGEAPEQEIDQAQYLEEALTHEDPAQEARIQSLVDQAVAARLAGIPRP